MSWEHFPHRADIGIRGIGSSEEEAFEQAAVAMTAVMTEPAKIECEQKVEISCAENDIELLLIDWLSSLLYEMDIRKMIFAKFEVHIENGRLKAAAWGEKINIEKHQPAVEIKGATYTALSVTESDGKWIAQCVVDV